MAILGNGLLFLLAISVAVVLYLLPAFVAEWRGHKNTIAIFLLNLLLGWTVLGWVIALVWAATN